MMQYTTIRALGQARLAEMHRQAERDALTRAVRRQHSAHQAPGLLGALTRPARRRQAAAGNAGGPLMPPDICRPR
jgi:hypothetical protein